MDYTVKNIKRIVVDGIDLNTARIILSNGLKLDVTFDRLQKNLIIHKWYKLEDKDHDWLRSELEKYFKNLLDQDKGNAA